MKSNKSDNADKLVFSESPRVEYATNFFYKVPIILQYDETPLIEVIQLQAAGFTTEFKIYNKDGVYIAKAKGSQLYLTEEGKKSNLILRHPSHITICELDGQTLFEIRRTAAAALRTNAELYTPDGRFIKSNNRGFPSNLILSDSKSLRIGGLTIMDSKIEGCRIGVHLKSDGSIGVGCS
jgi:hypothetical protein